MSWKLLPHGDMTRCGHPSTPPARYEHVRVELLVQVEPGLQATVEPFAFLPQTGPPALKYASYDVPYTWHVRVEVLVQVAPG